MRAKWRVQTAYTGAGPFHARDGRLYLGTNDGVECIEPGKGRVWAELLGSRCLGVIGRAQKDEERKPRSALVAACRQGLFFLGLDGQRFREVYSLKKEEEILSAPVSFADGLAVPTGIALLHFNETGGPSWRLDFQDVLGKSVQLVRPINLFPLGDSLVVGVVDYDTGIGRVLVVDAEGGSEWMSEPGPVTDVFPAGKAVFVWSQTGYGKFETRMTRTDGHEIWLQDFAGVGSLRHDGSLAILVGTNESPRWDDWEIRIVSASGKVERSERAFGRCPARPLCLENGSVFFSGNVQRIDPGESRADYTSFFAQPQEVLFQHAAGIRVQLPEYEVYLQKLADDGGVEVLHQNPASFAFGAPQSLGDLIVYPDGSDLVAFPA